MQTISTYIVTATNPSFQLNSQKCELLTLGSADILYSFQQDVEARLLDYFNGANIDMESVAQEFEKVPGFFICPFAMHLSVLCLILYLR
jgi:hypothetical protein